MKTRGTGPDILAARAIGAGFGLIALMLVWLIGNRLVGAFLDAPTGPIVAFAAAVAAGLVVAIVAGRRLSATAARDLPMVD